MLKKIITIFYLILFAFTFTYPVFAQPITSISSIGIVVNNLDKSVKFYQNALGFQLIGEDYWKGAEYEQLFNLFGMNARVAHLKLGEEKIDLIDFLTAGGSPIPFTQQSNDLSFQHIAIVVRNIDEAFEKLKRFDIEYVSTEPQTLPESIKPAAGVKAFYFHDPDNHNLELIYFPSDKGNPKWYKDNQHLFMGIDHTAIGIKNTNISKQLYSDWLGLQVKGESFNKGIEQEHLNNVEHASLHITGLCATEENGPGVEFLQYVVPGPGKPFPSDTRSDDIWNWYIVLKTMDVEQLYQEAKAKKCKFVSKRIVKINEKKQFIIRDNDGHALWIQQI